MIQQSNRTSNREHPESKLINPNVSDVMRELSVLPDETNARSAGNENTYPNAILCVPA